MKVKPLELGLVILSCYTFGSHAAICSRDEWKCDDSQCIKLEELCDGFANCNDHSDENEKACIGNRCPSYTFRCAYGACVERGSECNSIKDCDDHSDEMSSKCTGLKTYDLKKDNCPTSHLKCKMSGECIPAENVCDGPVHCRDKSDETIEVCSSNYCPSYGFRCDYGACVAEYKMCDGISDCDDGSDESPNQCGYSRRTMSSITHAPPINQSFCTIPYDLPNPITVYYADTNRQIKRDSTIPLYASIIYKCENDYVIVANVTNICIDGQWIFKNHPTCRKFCSSEPLYAVTIKSSCELDGEAITCNKQHQPKTRATINCAVGYKKPIGRKVNEVINCDDNGEWDQEVFSCEPVCGIDANEVTPLITKGENINITSVPWHVGIFSNIGNSHGIFTHICGGTIINAKVVISAAHCFWDPNNNKFHDKSNFKVGAGKYYRDLYTNEPNAQITDFEDIKYKREYNHDISQYALDIILLILVDHLRFNTFIRPICVDNELNYNEMDVQPGIMGKVAGWGLDKSGGRNTPELNSIDLPIIDTNDCKEKLPDLVAYIIEEKFCAGYSGTGQSVCQGDSGGGFVVPKDVGGRKVYFIKGIVSVGAFKEGSCDDNRYAIFTKVQHHIKMVHAYESENRPK